MIIKNDECITCKYKNWDCKNCYVDYDSEGDLYKPNIMFDIILTRKCNFRCNYCGINFTEDILTEDIIKKFLHLIKSNRDNLGEIRIEFFGGEPLLEFDKIKYIVESTYNFGVKYIIVTNGRLFTDEILKFLKKYKFDVIFSVSLFNSAFLYSQKDMFNKNDISSYILNFIIEPGKELLMYEVFKKLISLGFRKFNMLPAHYTVKWNQENLEKLDFLLNKVNLLHYALLEKNIKTSIYYGRSGDDFDKDIEKSDIEFILDCNGNLYGDYEAELYILNDIVPDNIFSLEKIYIDNITSVNFAFIESILKRKNIKSHKYLQDITDYLGINDNLESLGQIMAKNNINIK